MNWKLTDNKNWDSLEQQFQWVQDMNFVMQHHLHHEEGSVAVHTRMVLEALQQQPEYRALPAKSSKDFKCLYKKCLQHQSFFVRKQRAPKKYRCKKALPL